MRPEAQRLPTGVAEGFHLSLITLAVTRDLRLPIIAVVLGRCPVFRASVPETAVDEDGYLLSRKGDVDAYRPVRYSHWVVDPEAEAVGMQEASHGDFRAGVAPPVGSIALDG